MIAQTIQRWLTREPAETIREAKAQELQELQESEAIEGARPLEPLGLQKSRALEGARALEPLGLQESGWNGIVIGLSWVSGAGYGNWILRLFYCCKLKRIYVLSENFIYTGLFLVWSCPYGCQLDCWYGY